VNTERHSRIVPKDCIHNNLEGKPTSKLATNGKKGGIPPIPKMAKKRSQKQNTS
jgi:hypothetical protein